MSKFAIKKIIQLKDIGMFASFTQEKDFKYGENKYNIIFGFNGSGKTTLSNALSLFSDNSFVHEKNAIFEDIKVSELAEIKLKLSDNNICKCLAEETYSKDVYVFNSNFVTAHVFNGTKGMLKKFSNIVSEITNPVIEETRRNITKIETKKKELDEIQKRLETLKNKHHDNYKSDFKNMCNDTNKRLTLPDLSKAQLPSETLDELRKKIAILKADYDLSKKQEDLADDLSKLELLVFKKSSCDLIKVRAVLSKSIEQLSKEVLGNKIKEVKDLMADVHKQDIEKWFRIGQSVLDAIKYGKKTRCPICDTDISVRLDEILANFHGYFDQKYEDFIKELTNIKQQIQESIDLIGQCSSNADALKVLFEKYKAQIEQQIFDVFDFKIIEKELRTILNACDLKLLNIQSSFTVSESALSALSEANIAIDRFDSLKRDYYQILKAKTLSTDKIEKKIRSLYNDMILLDFNRSGEGNNLEKYTQNKKKLEAISSEDPNNPEGLLFHMNKRNDALRETKAESKGISKFLKIMGIDNFIVDINEEAPEENIVIKYHSCSTSNKKLHNSLSDGEKTALAFAYFLSKFENERDTEDKRKKSVVVIDDPISSLDGNRLYSTANLIHNNFKNVYQVIVLSHNLLFLKFFKSCVENTNIEHFFLHNQKLSKLPEELNGFESPYFYMLKNVIEFADGTSNDTYENAKKYLPNYIRRVLETFLSFKFAKITNKKNGKSPSLSDFDKNIDSLDIESTIEKDLKQKIKNIKHIADKHSHGNAQLTEENFYIAADELNALAIDAINVMNIIDSPHIKSINCTK